MTHHIRHNLNLVQLLYVPIFALIAIIFLSNWIRDLIVLEWDIDILIASILGIIILGFIVLLVCLVIYCIAKLYSLLTEVIRLAIAKDDVSLKALMDELNRIKSKG